MSRCSRRFDAVAVGLTVAFALVTPTEAEPKSAEAGTLVVVDGAGKEQKLKAWKFVAGTRHLSFLVPPPEPAEAKGNPEAADKPPAVSKKGRPVPPRPTAGPEALEFREEHSTNFVDGVLTLVPLARLKNIDYRPAEDIVALRIAAPKGEEDLVLTGTTKFARTNKLALAADVDRGELGVAEVRLQGGVPRGIRSLSFPQPKEVAAFAPGRPALVTLAADKQKKPPLRVVDLRPLYRLANGHEVLAPTLYFKKTLKLDIAKLQKLTAAREAGEPAWQVLLKDGGEETLTLLTTVPLDGREATLVGLLARVPAGYKLFPLHTVAAVQFDPADDAREK